jgi:hypothetical protein
MWKIRRSYSKRMRARPSEVFALQFADKPMYLERVSEDISGDLKQTSVDPNQDIQNQSSPYEPSL